MPVPVPVPMLVSGPVQAVPVTALSCSKPALTDSEAVPAAPERSAPDPAMHLSMPAGTRMSP